MAVIDLHSNIIVSCFIGVRARLAFTPIKQETIMLLYKSVAPILIFGVLTSIQVWDVCISIFYPNAGKPFWHCFYSSPSMLFLNRAETHSSQAQYSSLSLEPSLILFALLGVLEVGGGGGGVCLFTWSVILAHNVRSLAETAFLQSLK